MFQIYWSEEAKESYAATLQYLMSNFSLDVAVKVDDKVERLLTLLEHNQHLCPASKNFPSVRRCVISKQLSLVYRIVGNDIELIVFLDNRTNHPF